MRTTFSSRRRIKALCLIGIFLLSLTAIGVYFWCRHNDYLAQKNRLNQVVKTTDQRFAAASKTAAEPLIEGRPTKLVIPRLDLVVSIVDGHYIPEQRTWTVAAQAANYATNSSLSNNKSGKTFIYGHWYDSVLGRTSRLQPGDEVLVYTDNNHVFKYYYQTQVSLKPTDTWIFDAANLGGKPGLQLMTCEGVWAQNRRLMKFDLGAAV